MPATESQPKAGAKPKAKYPEEVREVAKEVRDLLGEKVKAPGAKQVAAVLKALGDRGPAEAAGISSARLRKWAKDGERPDDYAKLRDLAGAVGDPWATGRKLAAILAAAEAVRGRS